MHHHPNTEKKTFLQIVWDIVFIFFYPIITTFALLFVGLVFIVSSLSRLLSRLTPSKETVVEVKKPEWEPLTTCASFDVERLWVDEIMFGPAYYQLRTKPAMQSVASLYFGDFHVSCFGGLLLQKWNTTVPKELPDFDLVFLDGQTGELQTLKTIKAFNWNAEVLEEDKVLVKWFTGTEGGQMEISRKDVVRDQSLA